MSTPSSINLDALLRAVFTSEPSPSPEKESGVTLSTPITKVLVPNGNDSNADIFIPGNYQ